MNPVIIALFNALGNIYHEILYCQLLLSVIIAMIGISWVFRLGLFMVRKGWFKRSYYDSRAYKRFIKEYPDFHP